MAGKSGQKSRLSGRRGAEGRATPAKRQKGIKQFLQPRPPPPPDARDSSEEPEEQAGPSQTPAVGLLAAAAVPPTAGAPTGAGAMLQTALLRSLQHRFATQQALETPALDGASGSSNQLAQQGAAPMDVQQQAQQAQQAQQPQQAQQQEAEEDEDEEDEDGFQIFSQLAYEPTFLSQRPPEAAPGPDGAGPASTSQQPTQTQLPASQQGAAPPAGPATTTADEDGDGEWPASQALSQPAASQQQQADGARRASGVLAAPKTTPALQSSERIRCDAGPAEEGRYFPMFRTRAGTKRVYIVRHGESAYNEAVARGASWADPQIFDARLTEKGRQQARKLRSELAQLNLPADTLWVTSPLSRAIETLLLGCPTAHLLRAAPGGAGAGAPSASTASGSTENSAAAPNGGSEQPPRVMVLPCISEKVVTCGDIGHPASVLCKRFPELAEALAALPELWWYTGKPGKPNCALQKRFESHETKQQIDSRVGAFRKWLQERPETTIVAVGHSSYWRSFEESCNRMKPERMRNCEFRCIHY